MKRLFWLLTAWTITATAAMGSTATTRELPAAGVDQVRLVCDAGALSVGGVPGKAEIGISAEVEVDGLPPQDLASFVDAYVRLASKRLGSVVTITARVDDRAPSHSGARINLSATVPAEVDVHITDGSGPILVRNIRGRVTVDDDSGSVTIADIIGSVSVRDASGSISVENCRGPVSIRDGSGPIFVDTQAGNVMITDGSGDLTILHVLGNVTVADDSGSIDISDVSGDVNVREAGTGELVIERVDGTITLHDRSGVRNLESIKGNIILLEEE